MISTETQRTASRVWGLGYDDCGFQQDDRTERDIGPNEQSMMWITDKKDSHKQLARGQPQGAQDFKKDILDNKNVLLR